MVAEVEATSDGARSHEKTTNQSPPLLALRPVLPIDDISDVTSERTRNEIQKSAGVRIGG